MQVYSGPGQGWAPSRYIWNQQAYQPAFIQDNGEIKKTSTLTNDLQLSYTPANQGGNSMRQQLQLPGSSSGSSLPALTMQYPCYTDHVTVCNRGTAPALPGQEIVGFQGNGTTFTPSSNKTIIAGPCYTQAKIDPGVCLDVPCDHAGLGAVEFMINPFCTIGATCSSDAVCGAGNTCDLGSLRCGAICTNNTLPTAPALNECTGAAGSWTLVAANPASVCPSAVYTSPDGGVVDSGVDSGGVVSDGGLYTSATFARVFHAVCPLDPNDPTSRVQPVWNLLTWNTDDPTGTNVTFAVKTATTQAGLATATATTVGIAGYNPVGSSTLVDLAECDQNTAQVGPPACPKDLSKLLNPNNQEWLELDATLNGTGVLSPTLKNWNVSFNCPPQQ
jgi:hypothetical protein